MTLVDTSVWIDGFRGGKFLEALKALIDRREESVQESAKKQTELVRVSTVC